MPPNVTDKQLERALEIARHKLHIRWTFLAILFLVAAISLLFAASGMLSYFSQIDSYNRSMSDLWKPSVDWTAVHQQQQPQPLTIGASYVWPRGNNTYDLAAEITNSNIRWGVQRLDYEFFRGETVIARGSTTMLPNQNRMVTALGLTSEDSIDSVDGVRLTKINWKYIAEDSSSWWAFVSEPQFQARTVSGDGSGGGVTILPRVSWEVVNNTNKNLRQVVWQIILRTSGRVDQVVEYRATNVDFGIPRRYEVGLSSDVSRPDTVSVVPISDIYNADNTFLPDATVPRIPGSR